MNPRRSQDAERGETLKFGDLYETSFTTPIGRIGILADAAVYPLDAEY